MMPQDQFIRGTSGKDTIARLARCSLQPKAAGPIDRDVFDTQFDAETPTVIGTEPCPAIGIRGKAMMDMDGLQALSEAVADQNMQQDDGIATAGETDADASITHLSGREERADPCRKITAAGFP